MGTLITLLGKQANAPDVRTIDDTLQMMQSEARNETDNTTMLTQMRADLHVIKTIALEAAETGKEIKDKMIDHTRWSRKRGGTWPK